MDNPWQQRTRPGGACILGLVLGLLPGAAAAQQPQTLGWFEVLPAGPSTAGPAALAAHEELASRGLALLGHEGLLARLREVDQAAGRVQGAGRLLAEGRRLHLGLKLPEALERYRQAVTLLEEGFVRLYDPGRLAEPVLQIGVAEHQAGRRAEAEKSFMRAAALAPGLELDEGYYSPSVRSAFQAARERLGPLSPGIPRPEELQRICLALRLSGLIVVSAERVGDRPAMRLALFDANRARFVALESLLLDEADARDAGARLAARLWPVARALAGIPEAVDGGEGDADGGVDGGVDEVDEADGADAGEAAEEEDVPVLPPDGGPPPVDLAEPGWYVQHWWIWPVAAVVLGAAVAVPLIVLREDVVDVHVRIH